MGFRPLSVLCSLLLLVAVASAQADRLDLAAFQARMKETGAQLVDVRTPDEFAKGHIPGAVLNDWLEEGFLERTAILDRSKPVLLYCAVGGRSEDALHAMEQAGFTDVVDLREGFNAWKRNGLPISLK